MRSIILTAALTLVASLAHAGSLVVNLINPNQYGLPGSTLYYAGYLTNTSQDTIDPDTSETIAAVALFTTGDGIDPGSSWLTTESLLFVNGPLDSIAPGASSDPFVIFSLSIDPGFGQPGYDPLGDYTGTYTLLGGQDLDNAGVFQSDAGFLVHVVNELPAVSDTPEPASVVLFTSALALLVCCRMMRSRRGAMVAICSLPQGDTHLSPGLATTSLAEVPAAASVSSFDFRAEVTAGHLEAAGTCLRGLLRRRPQRL